MINLSEEWKKAYDAYLLEEESKEDTFDQEFDALYQELLESQAASKKSFDLLQEYYTIYAVSEGVLEESVLDEFKNPDELGSGEGKVGGGASSTITNTLTSMIGAFSRDGNEFNDMRDTAYAPVATYTIEKIGDMKFPNNLFFFLKQIIAWIGRVVIYFIEKFKNLIRGFLGKEPRELNPQALRLKFEKAQKVESISKVLGLAGGGQALDKMINSNNKVSVNAIESGAGKELALAEGATLSDILGITKKAEEPDQPTRTVYVSIDLSQDIDKLRELVNHFYDLFDNAYGSNREKLFEVGDLKVILEIFKQTIQRWREGNPGPTLMMGGATAEVEAISEGRVKENLIITNNNITALKEAYVKTADRIGDLAKVISSKELMALTDLGVSFKQLTSATYNAMSNLADTTKGRLKTAEKMYKDLSKMEKKYKDLTSQLRGMQSAVMSTSNITYDTRFNTKVTSLLNSAKYMTDVVTLRLVGLGLYIKELKDVRGILKLLANLSK